MTTKTKDIKAAVKAKERTLRASDAASAPGEHYRRTDGGFVLVKTTASGVQVEHPLSTFTASIIKELHGEHENGDTRVDGFVVEIRFRDWTKVTRVAAKQTTYSGEELRSFDDRLLDACRDIHPLASVMPGKEKHVIAAIKTLSAPQTIVKNGADSKTSNKTRKGNREA
jgi:hypothetical protein